jgi:hypothetical protein
METIPSAQADCGCANKPDRYVTFVDIDCAGNARRIMECIERDVPRAGRTAPFWPYFMAKRQPKCGTAPDDLFLIHCHINLIRELFDECGDTAAQALLTQVEEECC